MKPGNDLGRAGLRLSAGCVSHCVSNVCDFRRELFATASGVALQQEPELRTLHNDAPKG
jgi:hypothetical protein